MLRSSNIFVSLVYVLSISLCNCGQEGSSNDTPGQDTDSNRENEFESESVAEPVWVSLEFSLEKSSTSAGEPVSYTASLVAEDGAAKGVDVTIESDLEGDIAFDSENVTGTLVGDHALTATATENGQSFPATSVLTVVPGEPISLELSTVPSVPEVDTPVFAIAFIRDAYGNICDDAWTLGVSAEPGSDASGAVIDGDKVTFAEDGLYSLMGTVDSNGVTGTLGPFVVDSYGPHIAVDTPERGAWSTEKQGTVEGMATDDFSDVAELTVNGQPVTPGGDGSFSTEMEYEFGYNAVETLATDSDGNVTTDRRSVLFGDFKPVGSVIEDGIQARINENTIAVIEEVGEKIVKETDLKALIPSPVFEKTKKTFWGSNWYRLTLFISDFTLENVALDLDPRADGTIDITATIYKVRAPWNATGVLAGVHFTGSGTISADSIGIKMKLRTIVENGEVKTSISDVRVMSTGFRFDWNGKMKKVIEFFGVDLDNRVRVSMENAIRDTFEKEVPEVLEGALEDLSINYDFDLLGSNYQIEAKPYGLDVDDHGLTLSLETSMKPREWKLPDQGEGSLYYGYAPPEYRNEPGMILGLNGDFINQALYGFWGGGLLEQTFSVGNFEMPDFDFPYIPSEMENLNVVVSALLPPVAVPGTGEHLLDLQAGDIQIKLYEDDPSDPNNLFMIIYVGLKAGLDITVSEQNTLEPTISDLVTWFDLSYPTVPNGWEINLETLATSLVGELIPMIHDAIGSIPVPTIYGISLSSIEVEKGGAENGFAVAGGEIVVN